MSTHAETLRAFAWRLSLLLMLRRAVQWAAAWVFFWGGGVLARRISGAYKGPWLYLGLLGFVPLALLAVAQEWRRRVAFARVRAAYDGLNRCGGLLMAEEAAEMSAWHGTLPPPRLPAVRWRSGRSLGLLALSLLFAGGIICLPDP